MRPDDFIVFEKYKNAPANAFGSRNNPKSYVSDDDKQRYTRIHDALERIAVDGIAGTPNPAALKLKPMNYSPQYGARGHRPVDMWMSIVGEDSDAFGKMPQIYLIASERGVEIGFAVSIDEADYHDPNVKVRNREIVPRINAKLPIPVSTLAQSLSEQITMKQGWHFNRKARLSSQSSGFDEWHSLFDMITFLRRSGSEGGGGSITKHLNTSGITDELVTKEFQLALDVFLPLLLVCQPNVHEQVTIEIEAQVAEVAASIEFNPFSIADGRQKALREIATRRGQKKFRGQLLEAYGFKCAISGTEVTAVLEAAHIMPYRGPETNHITNGILLRTDIHTLFDLGLISIDPLTFSVLVSPSLMNTIYKSYHEVRLMLPSEPAKHPSREALKLRSEL